MTEDWFLYDNGLRHERVKSGSASDPFQFLNFKFSFLQLKGKRPERKTISAVFKKNFHPGNIIYHAKQNKSNTKLFSEIRTSSLFSSAYEVGFSLFYYMMRPRQHKKNMISFFILLVQFLHAAFPCYSLMLFINQIKIDKNLL